jgi:hypothetical protein
VRHQFRRVVRLSLGLLLAGTTLLAQPGPIQERITGARIDVPPISDRINVGPLDEGLGAFSPMRTSGRSRIFGIVINELGLIVPSAGTIIVRSLGDGTVRGETLVDTSGQFQLAAVDPGLYAAELVDADGRVVTASPSFSVAAGEIVHITPVVAQRSLAGLSSLVGSSTAGAVNSAVSAGVLAVQTPAPISP